LSRVNAAATVYNLFNRQEAASELPLEKRPDL